MLYIKIKYKDKETIWSARNYMDKEDAVRVGGTALGYDLIEGLVHLGNLTTIGNVDIKLRDGDHEFDGLCYNRAIFLGKAYKAVKANKRCVTCKRLVLCECHDKCHRHSDCEKATKTDVAIEIFGNKVARIIKNFMMRDYNDGPTGEDLVSMGEDFDDDELDI